MFKFWSQSISFFIFYACATSTPFHHRIQEKKTDHLLWERCQKAYQKKNFDEAQQYLKTFIQMNLAHPQYLEAVFLLGKIHWKQKKYRSASKYFQNYILATGRQIHSIPARIRLGYSYLELKEWDLALLIDLEIQKIHQQTPLKKNFLMHSQLIQVSALLGKNQINQALHTLKLAEKQMTSETSVDLKGKIFYLKLQFKIQLCPPFHSKKPLSEIEVFQQFSQQTSQIKEMITLFIKILKQGDLFHAQRSLVDLKKKIQSYLWVCHHPPQLPLVLKQSRKPEELKQYDYELRESLISQSKKNLSDWIHQIRYSLGNLDSSKAQVAHQAIRFLKTQR